MTETTGREFDTWCETEFGMARKLRVGCTILKKVIWRESAFESGEEILGRHAMTSFIENDRIEFL